MLPWTYFLWIYIYIYIQKWSWTPGSYGNSEFHIFRNLHNDLITTGFIYISINSAQKFPFLHILATLSSCIFMITILTGVRWQFIFVVLSCISLMIRDVEHFFHIPVDHLWSSVCSLKKHTFSSFTHFFFSEFLVYCCWDTLSMHNSSNFSTLSPTLVITWFLFSFVSCPT